MQLSTNEDVEAPIEYVFARLTDFDAMERLALRKGADLQRVDQGPVQVGSMWDLRFRMRGKEREAQIKLTQLEAPTVLAANMTVGGLVNDGQIELVALNDKRTRMRITNRSAPKTFSARLLLQSAKLAKARIDKRFKKRVSNFAGEIEKDYRELA